MKYNFEANKDGWLFVECPCNKLRKDVKIGSATCIQDCECISYEYDRNGRGWVECKRLTNYLRENKLERILNEENQRENNENNLS